MSPGEPLSLSHQGSKPSVSTAWQEQGHCPRGVHFKPFLPRWLHREPLSNPKGHLCPGSSPATAPGAGPGEEPGGLGAQTLKRQLRPQRTQVTLAIPITHFITQPTPP